VIKRATAELAADVVEGDARVDELEQDIERPGFEALGRSAPMAVVDCGRTTAPRQDRERHRANNRRL